MTRRLTHARKAIVPLINTAKKDSADCPFRQRSNDYMRRVMRTQEDHSSSIDRPSFARRQTVQSGRVRSIFFRRTFERDYTSFFIK